MRILVILLSTCLWISIGLAQDTTNNAKSKAQILENVQQLTDEALDSIRQGRSIVLPEWYDSSLEALSFDVANASSFPNPQNGSLCEDATFASETIYEDRERLLTALAERYGASNVQEFQQSRKWRSNLSKDSMFLTAAASRLLSQSEVVNFYEFAVGIVCQNIGELSYQLNGAPRNEAVNLAVSIVESIEPKDRPEWANPLWGKIEGEPNEFIAITQKGSPDLTSLIGWRLPPSDVNKDHSLHGLLLNWHLSQGAGESSPRGELLSSVTRILRNYDFKNPPDILLSNIFIPSDPLWLSKKTFGNITIENSAFSALNLFETKFSHINIHDTGVGLLNLDSSRGNSVDLRNISFLATGDTDTRKEIDLGYSEIRSLNIDGVKPGRLVTFDNDWKIVGEIKNERLELDLYEATIESWLSLENVKLSRIDAGYVNVAGRANFKAIEIAEFAKFGGGIFEELHLTDFKLSTVSTKEKITLNLAEIVVRGELELNQVTANDLYAAKISAKVLRTENLKVDGLLSLWGANVGLILLGIDHVERMSLDMLKAGRMELFASGTHWTGQRLSGPYMEVKDFTLENAKLSQVAIQGLQSDVVTVYCTSVSGQLGIMHSKAHEIYLSHTDATTLDIRRSKLASLYFKRDKFETDQTLDPEFAGSRPSVQTESNQQVSENSKIEKTVSENTCSSPNAPKGSFKQIWLASSEIRTLRLNGEIEEILHAPRLQVDKFSFAGDRARLGPKAIVNLSHATVGSLALPQGRMAHRADYAPNLWINGAQIGSVRLYDPNRDGVDAFAKDPVRPGYWPIVKKLADMRSFSKADYEALLYEELLPSLKLSGEYRTPENYSGATYQFLRRSFEEAGFPSLVRDVAVIQNDHYAQTLKSGDTVLDAITGGLLRQIYRMGKVINSYGYDNGRAVLWLFLLWLAGAVMLYFEARHRRKSAQLNIFPPEQTPWWPALFLSADRTIPSLGIDENFSRPAHVDGRSMQGTTAVTVLLYIQRLLAFVVVIFMVGGVLDVFQ